MLEQIDKLDFDEIKLRVEQALEDLRLRDFDLFTHLGSERNLAQRFAVWLERAFPEWNIDCEYNRIFDSISDTAKTKVAELMMQRFGGGFIKLEKPRETIVIPDIIIHRRGTRQNLIAIEVKTSLKVDEIEFDYEKLRAYLAYEPLRYRYALFVRFQEAHDDNQFIAEFSFFQA